MKFYLNNTQVYIEVAPKITETLDETLDNATVVLKANNRRLPYAPMQEFRIEFENTANDILYFLVASDNVELYSADPIRYKHTLGLVQNTRKLSKHLVRNSVFTQPANPYSYGYWATTVWQSSDGSQSSQEYGCGGTSGLTISLDSKQKVVNDTYVEFDFSAVLYNDTTRVQKFNTVTEFETAIGGTIVSLTSFGVHYTLNGVAHHDTIYANELEGGEIVFWKKIKCNKIKQLLSSGATDMWISIRLITPVTASISWMQYGFIQCKVYAETYYNSVYDVLDLLIKRQKQKSSTDEKVALFSLPTSGDLYNLLTQTVAPNFTFTQCTMYECIAEIFKLFDATFTLDANNVLGIEYFNDNDRTTVLESAKKLAGLQVSISEDKYTNKLVTYYQDARQERVFPSKNSFAFIRSSVLGTPESDSDHDFFVDKPIQQLIKCEFKTNYIILYDTSGLSQSFSMPSDFALDMTERVLEDSIWTLLSTGSNGNYLSRGSIVKELCINYTKGTNLVHCGKFYTTWQGTTFSNFNYACLSSLWMFMGITDIQAYENAHQQNTPSISNSGGYSQWYNTKMRLTYISTFDGRTAVESINSKADGSTLVNQNNGAVDLTKMGLNMLGVSLKSGEPSMSGTTQISSWANRIKKGVIYQDTSNNKWVANIVSYTLLDTDKIQTQISFVKNYNELSRRIKLNQEKRLTNVSSSLTQKSEDNIVDYVYFNYGTTYFSSYSVDTYIPYTSGLNAFKNTFGKSDTDEEIQYANIKTYENSTYLSTTYCPLVKYTAGNCLCFEISYESTLIAGNKTTHTISGTTVSYYTTAVKYSNDYGFVDKADIAFVNTPNAQTFDENFPSISNYSTYNITDLEVYKQPNEIFALNYELAFIPVNKDIDFLGRKFLEKNNFIIPKDECKKKFYLYVSSTFKYSILDTKGVSDDTPQELTISITTTSAKKQVNFIGTVDNSVIGSSFAVCDDEGNIYLASNRSLSSDTISYSFQFRKDRL